MKVYVVMWYDEAVGNGDIVGIYASLKEAEEVKKREQDDDTNKHFGYEFSIETYDLKGEENKSMESKIMIQFYYNDNNNQEAYPCLVAITQDQLKVLNWLNDHGLFSGFSIMPIEEP